MFLKPNLSTLYGMAKKQEQQIYCFQQPTLKLKKYATNFHEN